jgi:hypothetical protein
VVAVGKTFVVVTGGIDLSIGSNVALTGIITGLALHAGFPVPAAIVFAMVFGGAIGVFSARRTKLFVPICRNFDTDAPLQATLDFNEQVFAEDIAIVERQWPEDLPIDLHAEAHFPADRSSITYRQGLAALGLGRSYTA